jgi:acyl dehydratase
MTDEHGRATDEELARLRSKLGQKVEIADAPHLTEVTRDAIRHWAWATGDRNPLYLDEAHASASPIGLLSAPPCMLYAFSRISIGYRGGLPGVHSMFGGTHWRWKKPIPLGERISTEVTFKELTEFPSRFAGRMFKQSSHIRYMGSDGSELAEADSWGMRTERVKAREKGKYKNLKLEKISEKRLSDVAAAYEEEHPRGAESLFWEDVADGADVPGIVRGPYSATVAVAFEQAWGGLFIKAHSYWFEFLKRHPAAGISNAYGVPEPPEAVHWDSQLAQSVGVPEAYDYGPERISWLASMLTNWIGDHGFLEELYCEVRRFNLVGDVTYCEGCVTDREALADKKGRLKIAIIAKDQRGDVTAKGWATVILPRRD